MLLWLLIPLSLLIIFSPFIIWALQSYFKSKHDNKFPYKWTKVMKDANGKYHIMEWVNPSWDWEGFEKCNWYMTQYIYDTIEDASAKSTEINNEILYKQNASILTDIQEVKPWKSNTH